MAKNENSKHNALELIGIISIALTFVIGAIANYQYQLEFLLVMFLLSLPLFIQMIGMYVLRHKRNQPDAKELEERRVFFNFYVWTVVVSCASVYSLWGVYALNWLSKWPQGVSLSATCCIVILGILVAIMFWAGIKGPSTNSAPDGLLRKIGGWLKAIYKLLERLRNVQVEQETEAGKGWLEQLRDGAAKEKALVVLFFFTVFLSIAYLYAFAFAFHNKSTSQNTPGLYMKAFQKVHPEQISQPSESDSSLPSFDFEPGRSQLFEQDKKDGIPPKWKTLADRLNKNWHALDVANKRIRQLLSHGKQVRVMIVGEANDLPTNKTSYQSNYELGVARAESTKLKLLQWLSDQKQSPLNESELQSIEWLCASSSDDPPFQNLNELVENELTQKTSKPSARATIKIEQLPNDFREPQKAEMQLMDYIYFSIYTITTTGYGDIVPTTPYAKFLCSLANIYEVFFLVIFFGVLLSLPLSAKEEEKQECTKNRVQSQLPQDE